MEFYERRTGSLESTKADSFSTIRITVFVSSRDTPCTTEVSRQSFARQISARASMRGQVQIYLDTPGSIGNLLFFII